MDLYEKRKKQFLMSTKSSLKSRLSTINNAFAISITPFVVPDNSYYEELQIKPQQCGYCMRAGELTNDGKALQDASGEFTLDPVVDDNIDIEDLQEDDLSLFDEDLPH